MSSVELDKEQYREIISTYFGAFGTKDFSIVQFSAEIQFLSPIKRQYDEGPSGSGSIRQRSRYAGVKGERSDHDRRFPDSKWCLANGDDERCSIHLE